MSRSLTGVVYLVGAGPGDPSLLTLRGAELLARADVVAYDRLVHPDVLSLAPHARHEYVGRAPGDPDDQERVNTLLIEEARAGRVVVRLKGGDPFVFGRGGEECEALRDAGVDYEVVPGVTSAVAAPSYAGIPLTHRGMSSWVAIATAHEDDAKSESSLDWGSLARAGTVVLLMARRGLRDAAARLIEAGRDPQTPAVVVGSASLPGQVVVRSVLADVAADADAARVEAPATLVVGEVAGLSERLRWFDRRRLSGLRVLVTRPGHELPALLREQGADAIVVPTIAIVPADDPSDLDDAIDRLCRQHYAWVVLTSANAVDAVGDGLESRSLDARALSGTRVAVVGPSTAERLLARTGLRADLVPSTAGAAALAEAMDTPPKGSKGRARRVLYPRSARADAATEQALRRRGWRVDSPHAYSTMTDTSVLDEGRRALDEGADAVLFASGSSVRGFVELWGPPPAGALVCCIGPSAAAEAERLGVHVSVVARESTMRGLVSALAEAVRG